MTAGIESAGHAYTVCITYRREGQLLNREYDDFQLITKALSAAYECTKQGDTNEKAIEGFRKAEQDLKGALSYYLKAGPGLRQ